MLNQTVKRNIERFPEDFMFRLTKRPKPALSLAFSRGGEIKSFHEKNCKNRITSARE